MCHFWVGTHHILLSHFLSNSWKIECDGSVVVDREDDSRSYDRAEPLDVKSLNPRVSLWSRTTSQSGAPTLNSFVSKK